MLSTDMQLQPQDRTKSWHAPTLYEPIKKSSVLLHPLILFVGVWTLAFSTYIMHLSDLLIFSTGQVLQTVLWVVVPYVIVVLASQAFLACAPKKQSRFKLNTITDEEYLTRLEARLHWWFICWCILIILEIVLSGGVPIVWLIYGSSKDYSTFGLPSLNGFLNTLLIVIALSKLGIYVLLGDRRRLRIPVLLVLWSVVIISRYLIMVALLQWILLWFNLKEVRIKSALRTIVICLIGILIFGYIGDFRSGGETFRALAQPSQNYPNWLPSGFLWIYIYATTPLGNLVNTSLRVTPLNNILFPNTLTFLLPTIAKTIIYGKGVAPAAGGELVANSFNVSTAYVRPFYDYGYFGLALYSVILGVVATYYWCNRRTFRNRLIYTIVTQCLVFSIFQDFLFFPTILGQILLIYLLFRFPSTA